MKNSFSLFLEINELNFIFYVLENDELNNPKINYKLEHPLTGIENNRISDPENIFKVIKENIYKIEQKFNYTFKEIVLILENFNPTFLNLTGYKNLNGSQVLKENITYILNTLKSCVDKIEKNRNVVHIFNSKFNLDKKKIENLPIGLFGDFYSHELSFILINKNEFKNLKHVFDQCNLSIKKTLFKSFVEGANISNIHKNDDTFFFIQIENNTSKIFYFENNSLKFEQKFKFGTDIILKDISKITLLKIDTVKMILSNIDLKEKIFENDVIEEKFFKENDYRKIKKKLIYEIVLARINEIIDIMLFKNINLIFYNEFSNNIFLRIDKKFQQTCLKDIFTKVLSMEDRSKVTLIDHFSDDSILSTANKLVHFGWKNEAIPFSRSKKSLLARFFDTIFG